MRLDFVWELRRRELSRDSDSPEGQMRAIKTMSTLDKDAGLNLRAGAGGECFPVFVFERHIRELLARQSIVLDALAEDGPRSYARGGSLPGSLAAARKSRLFSEQGGGPARSIPSPLELRP